jgi:hypothetical protein
MDDIEKIEFMKDELYKAKMYVKVQLELVDKYLDEIKFKLG